MRNLLLIAYYYPPIGGVGVRRHHQLVRHIAKQGWKVTVVSRLPGKGMPLDERLLDEVPSSTRCLRARDFQFDLPQRFFWRLGWNKLAARTVGAYFPDFAVGWIPHAIILGRRALGEQSFDAVVSSGPPHSTHVVAARLAREFDLPWLVDYRDEWSDNPYGTFATPLHHHLVRRLEERLLNQADRVISATDHFTERIRSHTDPEKVFTLSNGYNEEDFVGLAGYMPTDRFTIGYMGRFYGKNSPLDLMNALSLLIETKRIQPAKIRFLHVGMGRYSVPEALASVVEQTGFVSHREAVQAMQKADMLTLIIPDLAAVSAKIYEYLRAGPPVLAVTPSGGGLAKLVHETRAGAVVEPGAVNELAETIFTAYKRWENGEPPPKNDRSKVEAYEWGRLSQDYLSHVEAAIEAHQEERS